jgi:cold shock CspA family protein
MNAQKVSARHNPAITICLLAANSYPECYCLSNKHRNDSEIGGIFLQTIVKKWFRDKDSGFLDNGSGPGILVRKADLVNCQFLRIGATVEFECHTDKQGLIAKNVVLSHQKKEKSKNNKNRSTKEFRFGVMT